MSKVDPTIVNDISYIVIYDMVGQVLKTIAVSELGNPISVSDLSAGMYLISLADKNQNTKMLGKFEVMR